MTIGIIGIVGDASEHCASQILGDNFDHAAELRLAGGGGFLRCLDAEAPGYCGVGHRQHDSENGQGDQHFYQGHTLTATAHQPIPGSGAMNSSGSTGVGPAVLPTTHDSSPPVSQQTVNSYSRS